MPTAHSVVSGRHAIAATYKWTGFELEARSESPKLQMDLVLLVLLSGSPRQQSAPR